MANTVKLTRRVNAKSPKYGYGFHRTATGYRIDVPFHSITVFNGETRKGKKTVRNPFSGLRFIKEDNRRHFVDVRHHVR